MKIVKSLCPKWTILLLITLHFILAMVTKWMIIKIHLDFCSNYIDMALLYLIHESKNMRGMRLALHQND